MTEDIISILEKSQLQIDANSLACINIVDSVEFIEKLQCEDIVENLTVGNIKIGDELTLEFSMLKLQSLGIFKDEDHFIMKYRYALPEKNIYFYSSKTYLNNSPLSLKHSTIVKFCDRLKDNSKHNYDDGAVSNILIIREDKSLFMSLDYSFTDLDALSKGDVELIKNFIDVLGQGTLPDKKNIFLNELMSFLADYGDLKFKFLLGNFDVFNDKALSTYNFYLRNFSYNKLKIELDTKALEFNQKLQSVINDSQTKLIAIPTAFVLVLSSLDYQNAGSFKNIISVIGLFIFSFLVQLFVNNQKSTLRFIDENVNYYKSTFKSQDIKEVEKAFANVSREKIKQIERLIIIETLLWLVPTLTLCLVLFLLSYQMLALLLFLLYGWIASNKILLKY